MTGKVRNVYIKIPKTVIEKNVVKMFERNSLRERKKFFVNLMFARLKHYFITYRSSGSHISIFREFIWNWEIAVLSLCFFHHTSWYYQPLEQWRLQDALYISALSIFAKLTYFLDHRHQYTAALLKVTFSKKSIYSLKYIRADQKKKLFFSSI